MRTGTLLWTFHVRPRPGEFGLDTWGDAWWYSGAIGAWCCLSADEELGYVYLPMERTEQQPVRRAPPRQQSLFRQPRGNRHENRQTVWHFQMVHHDLWDYDNVGPPVLATSL